MSANIGLMNERLTDEELVEQIKNGNRESFDVLVKAYFPIVNNRVQRLVPESDAEDVKQEIFLSLVSSIGNFQGKSAFSTWFHRITMNRVADYYRKVSRRREDNNKEYEFKAVDPWNWVDSRLTLSEALMKIPDKYGKILLMRSLEGLSFVDIAERLGLTYEAARSRYRQAMRMMQRRIES